MPEWSLLQALWIHVTRLQHAKEKPGDGAHADKGYR